MDAKPVGQTQTWAEWAHLRTSYYLTDPIRHLPANAVAFCCSPHTHVWQAVKGCIVMLSRLFGSNLVHPKLDLKGLEATAQQQAVETVTHRRLCERIISRAVYKLGQGAVAMEREKIRLGHKFSTPNPGNGWDYGFNIEHIKSYGSLSERMRNPHLFTIQRIINWMLSWFFRDTWDRAEQANPFKFEANKIYVRDVFENSPAWQAGLRSGDIVELPANMTLKKFEEQVNHSNEWSTARPLTFTVHHTENMAIITKEVTITPERTWRVPVELEYNKVINAYAYWDLSVILQGIPVLSFLYSLWNRNCRFRKIKIDIGMIRHIMSEHASKDSFVNLSGKIQKAKKGDKLAALEKYIATVLGHEMAHHKQNHMVKGIFSTAILNTVMGFFMDAMVMIWEMADMVIMLLINTPLFDKESRAKESEADVYGLYMLHNAQYQELQKIPSFWSSMAQMHPDTYLTKLRHFLGFGTHPHPARREAMLSATLKEIRKAGVDKDRIALLPKEKELSQPLSELLPQIILSSI